MKRTIDTLLKNEPFVRFLLVMNSGERYEVSNAQMAVLERDVLTIYRAHSNRYDVLRLVEVSSLEVLESEEKSLRK